MKSENGKRRPWLAITAAILLCILLSVPSTRWLFGLQTITLISNASIQKDDNALRLTANRHPNDYRLQVGYAVWTDVYGSSSPAKIKIERLQSLVDRFPSEPSLYAHILRYYTADKIKIARKDQLRLFPHDSTRRPIFGGTTA